MKRGRKLNQRRLIIAISIIGIFLVLFISAVIIYNFSGKITGKIIGDIDNDGIPDETDPDDDGDGYCDSGVVHPTCIGSDNCNNTYNPDQKDSYPPRGNGIGDGCDCESDFNFDGKVDGSDASKFKQDFGRSPMVRPCSDTSLCNGDFNCDGKVDGSDASLFKSDFGRSLMNRPCPFSPPIRWCYYSIFISGNLTSPYLQEAYLVFVQGDYAYVDGDNNRLSILNITNKSSPKFIGYLPHDSGMSSFFVQGDYVYMVNSYFDKFYVINITNKAFPEEIISISIKPGFSYPPWQPSSVFVQGDYAYVTADFNHSLSVIDISDKSSPYVVSYYFNSSSLEGASSVYVQDNYAFIASTSSNSLTIINITNKNFPEQIGYLKNGSELGNGQDGSLNGASSVFVQGDYAYVSAGHNDSMNVIDIADKTSPHIIGIFYNSSSFKGGPIFVKGNYSYFTSYSGNSTGVINITNKNFPRQVAYLSDNRLAGANSLYVQGDYAYVTAYEGVFNVVDITKYSTL